MNDQESLAAINRMQAAFPAWSVWVTNRSPDPQRTFAEYGRLLKPLPADCVNEGITRAQQAQPQPAYAQLINLVAQKAELARSRQRQPTDEQLREKARAFREQRKRREDERLPAGSSRKAMLLVEELHRDAVKELPEGTREERRRWVESRTPQIWKQIDAERAARSRNDASEPDTTNDEFFSEEGVDGQRCGILERGSPAKC